MGLQFEWIEEFVEKIIAKHGVEPEDVESALLNTDPTPFIRRVEDDKYTALAQVEGDGDYLFIVFCKPRPGVVRPISARVMADRDKRLFRRNRAKKQL